MTGVCVQVALCLRCCDVVYSRAQHDCHWCRCDHVMVDGGRSYLRVGWGGPPEPLYFEALVHGDAGTLYRDWNTRRNRYGWSSHLHSLPASARLVLQDYIDGGRVVSSRAPRIGVAALQRRSLIVPGEADTWQLVERLPFLLTPLSRRAR